MITLYDLTTQVQDDLNERFAYVKDSTLKAYHQIDIISIKKPLRIHRKNTVFVYYLIQKWLKPMMHYPNLLKNGSRSTE